MSKNKKSIVIIGGGPSSMMLACTLNHSKYDVTIIEKGKAIGRKFLVAGKGGFNLTHSEPIAEMVQKYEAPHFLLEAIKNFDNKDFRNWLSELGINTYVGSSKRVFPIKGIKPIEVLQAIKDKMNELGVTILTQTSWKDSFINNGNIELYQGTKKILLEADKVVFALGGSSWKITGSDGSWRAAFIQKKIRTLPFRSSNCALHINWSEEMENHLGKPIKNIALTYRDIEIKGELMITEKGIEGSPAYALSYHIGMQLEVDDTSEILLDLKPSFAVSKVESILSGRNKKTTKILREDLSLSSNAVALLKSFTSREEYSNPILLAQKIKKLPLTVSGISDIDEAISTVGGVDASALNEHMEFIDFPNHYVVGEMINWNGPTGGYLLQACFSMGRKLGEVLNSEC